MRKAIRTVHRWLAFGAGVFLMISAVTGFLLTFSRPLDRYVNSQYFQSAGAIGSYEDIAVSVRQQFGPTAQIGLRFPVEPNGSVHAFVKTASWDGEVFVDAKSAQVIGARAVDEGWYNFIFRLHSELLLHDLGKPILAASGAAFVVLIASGMVLWWPRRWAQAFRINLKGPALAFLFDGHRVAGAMSGLLVLASVATGVYVIWKPISVWVNTLAGHSATKAPALPPLPVPTTGPPVTLDAAIASATELISGGRLVDVNLPRDAKSPIRVRLHLPGDPHPNGMTNIWIDPRTGAILKHIRWDQADLGARLQGWIYPYHAGQLWGTAHLVVTALVASALAWLGVSGGLLWWRRRER